MLEKVQLSAVDIILEKAEETAAAAVSTANVPPLDLSGAGTPLVAFSQVRLLRAAYAGDLFQLLDNALAANQDIGVDADGWVDFAAAKTFCDNTTSTSHTVEILYDQSGNGNDASQTTTSLQPRYKYGDATFDNETSFQWFAGGYPVTLGDGGDHWTTGNVNLTAGSLYAIAVFNVKDWFEGRSQAILGCNLSTTGGVALYAKSGGTAQDWFASDALAFGNGSNSGQEPRSVGGRTTQTVQYGTPVIMEWILEDGGVDAIRLNGQAIDTKANTTQVPAISSQPLIIGGSGTTNEYLNGQLAELMVWSGSIPSASTRDAIFANLKNVYKTSALTAESW